MKLDESWQDGSQSMKLEDPAKKHISIHPLLYTLLDVRSDEP
jgi:hypothetical protein